MIHLFVIAGVPSAYVYYFSGSIRRKIASDVGELLVVPLPRGTVTPVYSRMYRNQLLRDCSDWVQKKDLDDHFSISLLYADSESEDINQLNSEFFPFALTCAFEPLQVVYKPNLIQGEVNKLAKQLAPICTKLRTQNKIIHEHLSSRITKTPLLLPPTNFGSEELFEALSQFQGDTVQEYPLDVVIKAVIEQFDRTAVRQKYSKEDHYVNSDGLVFIAPRYGRFHGNAHRNGHPPSCFLRGRARLGSSFNPRFHYDCVPSKGSLRAEYVSCHNQAVSVSSREHVNIAPNDYVRGREIGDVVR